MANSILNDVKKTLGLESDYDVFDQELIIHINTVFLTLSQLGVGPVEGFSIEDESATWDAYITTANQNAVKTYIYLRVRTIFDPPASSFLVTAMQDQIKELEWRLDVDYERTGYVDPDPPTILILEDF